MTRPPSIRVGVFGAIVLVALAPGVVTGKHFSAWGPATPEVGINTQAAEGCPIESPNGLDLYIASNRAGGTGDPDPNDIWVAHRTSIRSAWSAPRNVGMPVNSPAADFCPTPLTGKRLLFVSNRANADACGTAPAGDIYLTRRNPAHGWSTPVHLGCDADGTGPNFPGAEFGPSLVHTAQGTLLYFSSNGYGGDQDIYVSRQRRDGSFGPATVVAELSTEFDDFMPNVRRDGLEIVLNSNRPDGFGGQDIYTAHRKSTADPWSTPVNLGPNVNTAGNETRSSLSGDGRRLHFGRDGDIFVSTRAKVSGRG
jgi:WD40-like Beta Propeller Repeat